MHPDPTRQPRDTAETARTPARLSGILRTWHDDRGFGFIAPAHGGREVFVHISQFPRDGTSPTEGERLDYVLGAGRDGRPQAMQVWRKALGAGGATAAPIPPQMQRPDRREAPRDARGKPQRRAASTSVLARLGLLALLLIAAAWGYDAWRSGALPGFVTHRAADAPARMEPAGPDDGAAPTRPRSPATPAVQRHCDGRTHCSQMTSCEEATWFLQNCPGMEMDGDNDGTPCESQHCPFGLRR